MLAGIRLKDPKKCISIGMVCLAIAVSSLKFLHSTARFGPDFIDGIRGFLFGLAIGITLMGVILISNPRRAL